MRMHFAKTGGVLFLALAAAFSAQTATQQPSDVSITAWVNGTILEDPRVAPADIMVSTNEGIVTLTGSVGNLVQKKYAELEAQKIKGVLGVVNKLTVMPMPRTDIEIRQAIRRRIINSSVISSESIAVNVENGVVILSGTVPSYSEKQEASLLAGEVLGVKSVDNNIEVVYASKRPDAEISADVQAKIDRDVYFAGLPVGVLVENGVVTLSGEVVNAYEKVRATEEAFQVSNVTGVKNKLKVRWWEVSGVRNWPPAPSDSALEKSVGKELYVDLRIEKPWDVHVKAQNGHVTLLGTLPTMRQKLLAQQDAAEVVGVAWVSNRITVKGPWRDDMGIFADASFALRSDYALGADINLMVNSGTVTLTGDVNTPYEKSQAEKDVSGILGVQNVVNNITVHLEPHYFNNAIAERIEERLAGNWETWPVAGKISIAVREGTVTLTGQVDTWVQYAEAERIAFLTQGIYRVDNRLSVKGVKYQWEKFHTSPPDVLSEPGYTEPWRIFPYNH